MDLLLPTLTLLLVVTAAIEVTSVAARVCVLGTEPDESAGGRVRFVLPPGDPCSCTQVMLGGHNAYAPPRKDQPVYIDTLPKDPEGLRRSQGCPNENAQSEDPKRTSTSLEATSAAPSTTAIPVYNDCQDVLDSGHDTDGVHNILVDGNSTEAFCDLNSTESGGEGFIVIQKRFNGSVEFNRTWADYEAGFGDLEGEFWWGNSKLRSLTDNDNTKWELVVDLEAFDGSNASVRYDEFSITGDTYDLTVSEFNPILGNAGDGLERHQRAFTTKDEDNDDSGSTNCAAKFNGGWWYNKCNSIESNLNGKYSQSESVNEYQGVQWVPWKNRRDISLKGCQMKIRRQTTP
ncbi:microfibril-associated glycoprotein 4-like [Asterias rubens]|uniref:microfibril-associated glycoprotein 4-like n=1 Tax=Asterias rubens TaxID=7604 RepID=UPI001455C13A|nr:microfibril-associated glycoprotein 4-like [Asterias rubens]